MQKKKAVVQTDVKLVEAGGIVDEPLVRSVETGDLLREEIIQENTSMRNVVIGVYGLLLLLGVGTGYLIVRLNSSASSAPSVSNMIKSDKVSGSTDQKTFKDSAIGVVEKGGFSGEGTHKLIREGGPSQTAYILSSVIDLDQYVGKKVTVWGQTIGAKKVSWLMDVGKIQLE